MKKTIVISVMVLAALMAVNCKKTEIKKQKSVAKEQATILVDQTLKPIIEDQVMIFEDRYPVKINLVAQPEAQIIQSLAKDYKKMAILSRNLTADEIKFFDSKKIHPKLSPFGKDALALIVQKSSSDTLISLQQIIELMQGKSTSHYKGLVFDNPNSSTARELYTLAGLSKMPEKGVFSFNTTEEVFNYVAHNSGMIGVVGINFIFEPSNEIQDNLNLINVLSVKNKIDQQYYYPSQDNIAAGKYPLARDLFVANCQGNTNFAIRFSNFITSEIGQRIMLKSGLVPVNFPTRKIQIRNTITNPKK